MDERQALLSFSALSQETRLSIVRALVIAGPEGLAAGVIAERMGVSATNVSFHLWFDLTATPVAIDPL
jgi:ArsR family transcriptional regulator